MTFPTTHPALARALAARDYATPTAVQTAVLEADKAADLTVSAQTGSGKTVAFGLALAPTLLGEAERFEYTPRPQALVIAPTRELAMQVQRELVWLYAETGARIVTCVGGMDGREEARRLRGGVHIVVGTPGRLRDHLERRALDLSELKAVVLDEADEMLDLGFREDLEFLLDATPASRRTLLFSATMPAEIVSLARRYQKDAVRIETARGNVQHADIDYLAHRVSPRDIENAVVNVLRYHDPRAAIVFCSTREAVKRLHSRLVERGFSAVALSGELTQNERTHALQAVRDGRARVLIATDVAARGLDLPDLALVVHADLPHDSETLVHRSGRTGRAGKKGLCVVIVPFNRRRKADTLLTGARIRARWAGAPSADEIRARDGERLLADPMFEESASESEIAQVAAIQAAKSPEAIALAFVRLQNARLPAAEELEEDNGPPVRQREWSPVPGDRPQSRGYERRPDRSDRGPGPSSRPRNDDASWVWFRLSIGRERNADPRWLLPLICRAGEVSKSEVGAIRVQDHDTRFQVASAHAERFAAAVLVNKPKEGRISREGDAVPADHGAPIEAPPPRDDVVASEGSAPRAEPRPEPSHERAPRRGYVARDAAPEREARSPREFKPRRDDRAPREDKGSRPERQGYVAREARPPRDDKAPRQGKPQRENRWRQDAKPPHDGKAPRRDTGERQGYVARDTKPPRVAHPTTGESGGANASERPRTKHAPKAGWAAPRHQRPARGTDGKPVSKYQHKKKSGHRKGASPG